MTSTERDEVVTALRVVSDAGYEVLLPGVYPRLCAWLSIKGWPPASWQPGMSTQQADWAHQAKRVRDRA